ncbi:unnamed protein product, partial [Rotaria sp. Silwood2]
SASTDSTTTTSETTTVSTTTTSETTTTVSTNAPSIVSASSFTSNWFGYEMLNISCLATLTNLTIQITAQKTVGATYNALSDSFAPGVVSSSHVTNGVQIIYTWTIISGQNIACVISWFDVKAQFNLVGTQQIVSADTYMVTTTTSAGVTSTYSGYF